MPIAKSICFWIHENLLTYFVTLMLSPFNKQTNLEQHEWNFNTCIYYSNKLFRYIVNIIHCDHTCRFYDFVGFKFMIGENTQHLALCSYCLQITQYMFNKLGFSHHWSIDQHTILHFLATVQKNYREPAYHNWTHAYCVGHFVYLAFTRCPQLTSRYMDKLEQLSLFIGALCHDIDHRGYNNHYQVESLKYFSIYVYIVP